ncbi:MAG: acylglycerol kinase family protein [bacterium]|nr:acylglycerol kinase family protein [bacterium]
MANPNAGSGAKDIPRIARLRFKDTEILIGVTTHPGQIRDVFGWFLTSKVDVIVILGGDGTVQKILTIYFTLFPDTVPPPILPARGGSMNIVANNCNPCIASPCDLIQQMITQGFTTVPHRLLKVESDEKWASATLPAFGSIFSLGAVVEMLKWYGQGKPGMSRALQTIAYGLALGLKISKTTAIKTDQHKLKIKVDGHPLGQEKFLICFASTVPRLILRSSPFPIPPGPNFFAWLAYSISALECTASVMPLALGLTPFKDQRYQFGAGETMTFSDVTSDFTLDGEIFTNLNPQGAKITVSTGPTINIVKVNSRASV